MRHVLYITTTVLKLSEGVKLSAEPNNPDDDSTYVAVRVGFHSGVVQQHLVQALLEYKKMAKSRIPSSEEYGQKSMSRQWSVTISIS